MNSIAFLTDSALLAAVGVAPQGLPPGRLRAANPAACNTLDAIRLLSQQPAVCISLPSATAATSDPTQLTALCQAVSTSGRLHPDPVQANLRSLYPYLDVAAAAPPQPSPGSGSKRPHHKRPRTSSPLHTVSSRSRSRSRSSTPRYNTWKHLDLAVGEREKIMAELLRHTENKERAIEELLWRADN
ncbi:hypothetical protein VM1G_11671 [Cytospora mali]|uniref:Uncharacterized protein n=1 Tax=Cytospora mali TaxID=578113 RepID=A0A194W3B6_CYTMA|nr:hypothetical protein VM1G_11671 [Valsa mali]